MTENTEKTAGSNLTAIAEYTETAAALAELRQRHHGVVYDVTNPKEMKKAKEARAELRGLRVALEKKRQELKAPVLERGRLLDSEAKRITEELVALEDPIDIQIKAEEARAEEERLRKLEEERQRVEAIQQKIQALRDVAASLVGKPSVIIQGRLERLRSEAPTEEEFAEHFLAAQDAHTAAIARVEQQLQAQLDHEEEQRQIARDREELERQRAENERLQREAEERAAADARRERDRVEAIHSRLQAIEDFGRDVHGHSSETLERKRRELQAYVERLGEFDFAEFKSKASSAYEEALDAIDAAITREKHREEEAAAREAEEQARRDEEARIRAEEDRRLQEERDRQAAEQKRLDEDRARLERERREAEAKAERERLASLTLRDAALAAVRWFHHNGHELQAVCKDLEHALGVDNAKAAPARQKKAANA